MNMKRMNSLPEKNKNDYVILVYVMVLHIGNNSRVASNYILIHVGINTRQNANLC